MDNQSGLIRVKRALFSAFDKRHIEILARSLQSFGCEIISTGGTRQALEQAGVSVTDITSVTGNPEAFGGRMKTISFEIESSILFDRQKDREEAEKLGIQPIDMVVCNLYPFEKMKKEGAELDVLIENIDIGGPTMIRAGAKNYRYVAVITDPMDYEKIVRELEENQGALTLPTRHCLMRKAFNNTADYDSLIAETMDHLAGEFSLRLAFDGGRKLRYGENSHQQAMFFKLRGDESSLHQMKQHLGKELSYNNINDIHAAIDAVKDLKRTGCAIIKHANPCGLSEGENQLKVFEYAWAGDPVSAFGSVIAFNRTVTRETAEFLKLDGKERKFVEVIVAPAFEENTIEYLTLNKNLRVIECDIRNLRPGKEFKFLLNSLLHQDVDQELMNNLEIVTRSKPVIDEELARFAYIAVRQLKSNAIAVVRRVDPDLLQLLGMGCGQPNRVTSTELALKKCLVNLKNDFKQNHQSISEYIEIEMSRAILVSDAFFPFPDNVELCGQYGIKTIYQPGGSIRDKSVIEKCDELGISMVFTGLRHFKH